MITINNLSKTFGTKVAVDDISFTVERGEVLGFLGPNGAGKSTTMRMIVGFTAPTGGTVTVNGIDVHENPIPAQKLMGYLPEHAPSYSDMSVAEFLGFAAELRGLRGERKREAIDRVIETCFLASVRHQSIATLSKGFRHRTCFAQAIIHDPDVLIMDEPTDGLDPNQKHEIRLLLQRMGRNKAIIFSTHILEEVEAACTRAIIIDQGRIVANGTPDELKRQARMAGAVLLEVAGAEAPTLAAALRGLGADRKIEMLSAVPPCACVRVHPLPGEKDGELSERIYEIAARERWRVRELRVEEGRLDAVFRQITEPETREGRQEIEEIKTEAA